MSATTKTNLRSKHRRTLILCLLLLILALGAFLRFYQLGASGAGNLYYAAAVKSMLGSWHNFFFVAFEPGGSVSVDKPPLGFWVQCLSAAILGVNGFALALPNALAGVFSIFLVYVLLRRPFGEWIGLLGALALALTPVAVSAERNNTIDGLLVFVLLLAAWAVLRSVYTRKVGWLFLGMALVGLGFNIKMLQAFLPLPGFYALYLFGARYKFWQKCLHLALATLLLLVVSFSWAVAVDLTPPENRPYVGGSEDNTVMELIFGHNGISRLIGGGLNRMRAGGPRPLPPPGMQTPPAGQIPVEPGSLPYPPGGYPAEPGMPPGRQSTGGAVMDVGTPGTARLFTFPLAGEIGWILPFVLGGLVAIAWALHRKPFDERHAALILWAGWLIPESIYFTYSTGIMHAYYMIMMAPPLAALFAMSAWAFRELTGRRKSLALAALLLLCGVTLVFQAGFLRGQTPAAAWVLAAAAMLIVAGVLLIAVRSAPPRRVHAGLALMFIAVLLAPGLWSALTTFNTSPNNALPYSGPAQAKELGKSDEGSVPPFLLAYLLENHGGESYLLATLNANQAAPYILETGMPVFTFGGFGGMDVIVDAEGLAEMVAAGELRFVLNQGLEQRPELLRYLQEQCTPVQFPAGGRRQAPSLFDCGG